MPGTVYTGVAGHLYEPANHQQIHNQQEELRHEGGGYWVGSGGYHRTSPSAYGFWNRQRWGWGDNQPYHYHAPSYRYSWDNERSHYHHEKHEHNKRDSHDWHHHHHWTYGNWGGDY